MRYIYTLKIRYSGEEDDVFVFSTREKAEAHVYAYFEHITKPQMKLNDFQEYLFVADIGYFDIEQQQIL